MNNFKSLKLAGLLIATVSFTIACAGITEEPAETPEPTAAPTPREAPAPEPTVMPAAEDMSQYEVERGDSLWAISGKSSIYGNPYQWPLIYKANSDKIKDADLIYPGQVFDIDNNPSAYEVDRAVNHARTRGSWSLGVVEESDQAYLAQ